MRNLALAIALVLVVGCGGDDPPPAALHGNEAAKILEQTPWLDRAPQDESDVIHAYIFPRGEGVYFTGNAYKGSYEVFRYFIEDDELRLRFIEEGKSYSLRFRVERFQHEVFDYRLTLTDAPRGPKVYYGFDPHKALPKAAARVIDRMQ